MQIVMQRRHSRFLGTFYFAGAMFVLFNATFLWHINSYPKQYALFRLLFSAAIFGAGGFLWASYLTRRRGPK
jgi:hypothetical protein